VGPGRVDWLSLLDGWVSDKKAPGELTATAGPGQAAGGPPSQVLCPYPGVARKTGETYACALGKKKS
jgi:hypothetical protein